MLLLSQSLWMSRTGLETLLTATVLTLHDISDQVDLNSELVTEELTKLYNVKYHYFYDRV